MSKSDDGDVTRARVRTWQFSTGIALFAFVVRILPLRNVFIDGQTYFTDSDSYYHLRRIAYNLASFPQTLELDPYLNFPDGAKAIWPQTLDWLLAALLLPFGVFGAAGAADYERVLAWLPPVAGALTVFAVHRIVARHVGVREATASALVLALLPAHFWYSQIGFLDHHVFVALGATLLLGCTLNQVRAAGAEAAKAARLQRSAAMLGALQAFNLAIWPGALLYVALSSGGLLGLGALGSSHAVRRNALRSLLVASLVACAGIAPLSLGNTWPQWSSFSAVVLSNFQPWWFATSALVALFCMQVSERKYVASVGVRFVVFVFVGVAFLSVSIALLPDLEASVRDSLQWLGKSDSFQAMVGESVPLFVLHGKFTTQIASSRLSYFIYLFPVALLLLAIEWRNSKDRAVLYNFVLWAVVLFGFTLMQKRFFNTFSVALAIAFGVALMRCDVAIRARTNLAPAQSVGVLALVAALLLAPCFAMYRSVVATAAQTSGGETDAPDLRIEANLLRREMTQWLRENTPETDGYLESGRKPAYGVLARWGEGHFITYHARRPAVLGNFGDDLGREHFLLARSFFDAAPDRAAAILEELEVRYVVIRSRGETREMATRLFTSDGSRLARYRVMHEVRPHRSADLPSYKIFEFVPGAVLEGGAPARALVRVELDLTTNLGRETRFEMVTQANAEGRYRVRLPYSQRPSSSGNSQAVKYRVLVGEATQEVAIDESAVQQGATVLGPTF